MAEMVRASKLVELEMTQIRREMLTTFVGRVRGEDVPCNRLKNPKVTATWLVTEEMEMCLTMETNAAKDPGHSRHHPRPATEYQCLLQLFQWLCPVGHAI
ncbi:hypothetical protein OS493_040251 [Desmophyllum pertusum]|uniref:Uncharacterized protein n=1 Tax=Desmophyllum pertusum TaxID=174260 RepID=A0A9X0CMY6_9CNID|nr:hypothetical protein OS493_040251 [Desmophyllum pertusum]